MIVWRMRAKNSLFTSPSRPQGRRTPKTVFWTATINDVKKEQLPPELLPLKSFLVNVTGTQVGRVIFPPSPVDPIPSPTDPIGEGDLYYNNAAVMNTYMMFDGSRDKWLSIESQYVPFGRGAGTGIVAPGAGYRYINGGEFGPSRGIYTNRNGTVIAMGYTRADSDESDFEVRIDGVTTIATLESTATEDAVYDLDGDFSAGDILGVFNEAAGNDTEFVQAWMILKWRAP